MKWLNNFKIRQKLVIGFLIVAFLIGIVGLISTRNMGKINSNEVLMYNRDLSGIKDMSAVRANLIQINFDMYKILNDGNKRSIQNLIDEVDTLKKSDDSLLAEYEKTIYSEKDRFMFKQFNIILSVYRAYRYQLLNYINNNEDAKALEVYTKLEMVNKEIIRYIENYVQYKEQWAQENYLQNTYLYNTTLAINIFVTVLGFIIALILGIKIASGISKKLEKVLAFAQHLAMGDLEKPIDIDSKDEIGALANALNKASAIRRQYEIKLHNNYEELEASYEEIIALEADLREKYQELEASFEEITALEEELREKYDEIAASEEELRESDEWYRLITEASYDVLWNFYFKNKVKYVSNRWYEILGYEVKEGIGINDWLKFVHPDDIGCIRKALKNHWKNKTDMFTVKYRIKAKNGEYLWLLTVGKTLYDVNGSPYRTAGTHKDITDNIRNQEKLEHMAYHDYLTNLPNRQYMYKTLSSEYGNENLSDLSKQSAVIFIDLDNFKYINDTMGHNFGDGLIQVVGERVQRILSKNDTLIRLGGDEFVIFAKNVSGKEYVENFVKNILEELNKPFEVLCNSVKITASIGISMFPRDGSDLDELLKKSDIAMYGSKYEGKNNYTFFESNMNEEIVERMNIEKYLNTALMKEEFVLYFQPQVEVKTGKITSFEALIRWNSPELGFISPLKFITIAEENHMITEIGNWVIRTACKFIKGVHDMGRVDCFVSVNVSILQLVQSDFVDNICNILEELELSPSFLELEVTESVFIDSFEVIRKNIELLKDIGVKIALDDFGKGYSSLSYLKQLPINTLKIDKSFVDDINRDSDNSLVENIIVIGHKMNLEVVAEGVELAEQANYLKEYNCDKIQGYLYSKPIPEEEALRLLYNIKL